jgi:hypothetical protein
MASKKMDEQEANEDFAAFAKVMADRKMDVQRFCANVAVVLNKLAFKDDDSRGAIQRVLRLLLEDLAEQDRAAGKDTSEEVDDLNALVQALRCRGLEVEESCAALMTLIIVLWRSHPENRSRINKIVCDLIKKEPGILEVPEEQKPKKRIAIYRNGWGVYLGTALGLQAWSYASPMRQPAACTFSDEEAARKHMAEWKLKPPLAESEFRLVPVEADVEREGLFFASIRACVVAGLPEWNPFALPDDN